MKAKLSELNLIDVNTCLCKTECHEVKRRGCQSERSRRPPGWRNCNILKWYV